MKRALTFLMTATLLVSLPTSMAAQKDKIATSQRHMMTSEGSQTSSGHKFIIDGKVALDVQDAGYNLYITDIDKEITMADFVESVGVKDKKFRFETELNNIKVGRLRPVMSNGDLGSAWIDIYFIPGFNVDMTIHKGYFDIHNEQQYSFMSNAWLNKDALAALFNSFGIVSVQQNDSDNSGIEKAISVYQDLLADLSDQLKQAQNIKYVPTTFIQEETKRILDRMEKINLKMQELIDKYADSIKF